MAKRKDADQVREDQWEARGREAEAELEAVASQQPNRFGYFVREGEFSLSYPSGGDPDIERVRITVADKSSGSHFLVVEVPLTEFARALSCRGDRPCRYELSADLSALGKTHEHKNEVIEFPGEALRACWKVDSSEPCPAELRPFIEPFEVDGWKARWRDAVNHHNQVSGRTPTTIRSRVHFDRFV